MLSNSFGKKVRKDPFYLHEKLKDALWVDQIYQGRIQCQFYTDSYPTNSELSPSSFSTGNALVELIKFLSFLWILLLLQYRSLER